MYIIADASHRPWLSNWSLNPVPRSRMSALEPIRSGSSSYSGSTKPSRPSTPDRPAATRVFTGQHLDDQSTYHNRESIVQTAHNELGSQESSSSVELRSEKLEEVGEKVPEGARGDQQGTTNGKDVEAPLEKKESRKSAKDANLVGNSSPCKSLTCTILISDRSHGKVLMIPRTQRTGPLEGNGLLQ